MSSSNITTSVRKSGGMGMVTSGLHESFNHKYVNHKGVRGHRGRRIWAAITACKKHVLVQGQCAVIPIDASKLHSIVISHWHTNRQSHGLLGAVPSTVLEDVSGAHHNQRGIRQVVLGHRTHQCGCFTLKTWKWKIGGHSHRVLSCPQASH